MIKKILYFLLLSLFILTPCFSQPTNFSSPTPIIGEEDGSPSTRFITAKFPNDTVTDNGDGTVSIDTSLGAAAVVSICSSSTSMVCDYTCDGADDDAQFVLALADLPAGGGMISLSDGQFFFGDTVTISQQRVLFIGQGTGTIISPDDADFNKYLFEGDTDTVINSLIFSQMSADGRDKICTSGGFYRGGQGTQYISDVYLQDMIVREFPSDAVIIHNGWGARVIDVWFEDNGADALVIEEGTQWKVTNSHFSNNDGHGINSDASAGIIIGNSIEGGAGNAGINLTVGRNKVIGNTFMDRNGETDNSGIILSSQSNFNIIADNNFVAEYADGMKYGIQITGNSDYNTIENNTFSDDNFTHAILIDSTSDKNTLLNNMFAMGGGAMLSDSGSDNAFIGRKLVATDTDFYITNMDEVKVGNGTSHLLISEAGDITPVGGDYIVEAGDGYVWRSGTALSVGGYVSITDQQYQIRDVNGNVIWYVGASGETAGTGDGNDLMLLDWGNSLVGIGTSTPSQLLDVDGTANATTITEGGISVHNNDEMDASSELAAIIDDETGTGNIVFSDSPTFTTAITATALIKENDMAHADHGDITWGDGTGADIDTDTVGLDELKDEDFGDFTCTDGAAKCEVDAGDVDTATALAANPSDCAANQFAHTIAANGNLTCSAVDIGDDTNLTADDGLLLTGDELDVILVSPGVDADSATDTSPSGLEFVNDATGDELTMIRGCDDEESIVWDDDTDEWRCKKVSGIWAVPLNTYINTEGGGGEDLVIGVGAVDKITLTSDAKLKISVDEMVIGSTTSNPEFGLEVQFTSNDMPAGAGTAYAGEYIYATVDQSADSSRSFQGLYVSTQDTTLDDFEASSVIGINSLVTGSSSDNTDFIGIKNTVAADSNGTISESRGILSSMTHLPGAARTITDAYGISLGLTDNADSTITNYYGLYLDDTISGTVTNHYGIYQVDESTHNYIGGDIYDDITMSTEGVDYGLIINSDIESSDTDGTGPTYAGLYVDVDATADGAALYSEIRGATIYNLYADTTEGSPAIIGGLHSTAATYRSADQLYGGYFTIFAYEDAQTVTVTDAYGITIEPYVDEFFGTTTVTNYYGIYLKDQLGSGTITNEWGVYQEATSATNFFEGSIQLDSDSNKLYLGEDQDMEVYHTGSHGYVDAGTGTLYLAGGDNNVKATNSNLQVDSDVYKLILGNGGEGEIYFDAADQLTIDSTTGSMLFDVSGGSVFTFDSAAGVALDGDGMDLQFGEDQDAEITHDGTDMQISTTTGAMKFNTGGTYRMGIGAGGNIQLGTPATNYAQFDSDGDLSFGGTAYYEVPLAGAAFVYDADNDYGLWFEAAGYTFTGAAKAAVAIVGPTGIITANGLTMDANENITLGAQTIDHDGTDFVISDSITVGGADGSSFGTDVTFATETDGALTYLLGGGDGGSKTADGYLKGYNGQLYTSGGLSIPMPVSGSVTKLGCSVDVTVQGVGATWDFEVHKNGSSVFSCQIDASSTGVKECTGDQARDTDQFAANDNLTLYANETAGAATIADMQCAVWGYFDE